MSLFERSKEQLAHVPARGVLSFACGGMKQLASANAVLRRGLDREEAAAYVGISATKFDELVADGRMPQPKKIDARRIWDVRQLDAAFDALPGIGDAEGWGEPSV